MILKNSFLSQSGLPYFIQVNLFVVRDQQTVILLKQTILRGRPFHHLILLVIATAAIIGELFRLLLRLQLMRTILIRYALHLCLPRYRRQWHRLMIAGFCSGGVTATVLLWLLLLLLLLLL